MLSKIKLVLSRVFIDIKKYWIFVVIFLAYHRFAIYIFGAYCPVVLLTGYPCPGCGMTRAAMEFIKGEWLVAYNLNLMVYLWVAFGIYFFVVRYVFNKEKKLTNILLIVLLVLQVLWYIYRMFTEFPGEPPMSYWNNNLINRVPVVRL